MASKEKTIPPSKGKKKKKVCFMHSYDLQSWASVLATQKEKKCSQKGREGDRLQSTGCDSMSTTLPRNVAEKVFSHIFLCKYRWLTVFDYMAAEVLKHRIKHRTWISTNGKVTMVVLPGWVSLFLMLILFVFMHVHTRQYCSVFNSHFLYCLNIFLYLLAIKNSSFVHTAQIITVVCKTKTEYK